MNTLLILIGVLIYGVLTVLFGLCAGRCIDEMGGPDDE